MYMKRNNPKNIAIREKMRTDAIRMLQKRASHSLRQLEVKDEIEELSHKMMTGLSFGPAVGMVSGSAATVWASTVRPGSLEVEISRLPTFDDASTMLQFGDCASEREGDPCVGSVKFENLESSSKYYYRCCLKSADGAFPGLCAEKFTEGTFKTLPDSDEHGDASFVLGNVGSAGFGESIKSIARTDPCMVVFLGSLLPPKLLTAIGDSPDSSKTRLNNFRKKIEHAWCSHDLAALAQSVPFFAAFNDSTKGSDDNLAAEESALGLDGSKSSSKKKSRKSSSVTGSSPALKSFGELFPTELIRKPTRHVYRKIDFGINCEIFLLDTRCGYLGASQYKWLTGGLEASSCMWKVIVCVPTALFEREVDRTVEEVAAATEEELSQQAEAAKVIQEKARQREKSKEKKKKRKKKGSMADVKAYIKDNNVGGVVFITGETRSNAVVKSEFGYEFCVGNFVTEQHPSFNFVGGEANRVYMETKDNDGFSKFTVKDNKALVYEVYGKGGEMLDSIEIGADGEVVVPVEEGKEVGGEEAEGASEEKKE
jgi:phosphodiesterase/alkaline phosphatase D-like protein